MFYIRRSLEPEIKREAVFGVVGYATLVAARSLVLLDLAVWGKGGVNMPRKQG